jgi:hypothetical protein
MIWSAAHTTQIEKRGGRQTAELYFYDSNEKLKDNL